MLKFAALASALFLQAAYAAPGTQSSYAPAKHVTEAPREQVRSMAGGVVWHAVGSPGFIKIDGKGGTVAGKTWAAKDGKFAGRFVADLSGFKTGMELRDKHMHQKYLETQRWKEAFLDLDPWAPTTSSSKFSGKLTLKGVAKPVFGTAVWDGKKLKAEFEVELDDFPIGVPNYLGVTVAKTVAVEVNMIEVAQ